MSAVHRYARVSTNEQDLTAQRNSLVSLNVPEDRIYVDHGLTGTNRERPEFDEALAGGIGSYMRLIRHSDWASVGMWTNRVAKYFPAPQPPR
ncbi:hypothetical protein IWX64_001349 [Arthrobacter sp. CAN_A212]|nr:hypothetical protein [Arthrobacter sp. CAN_C5]